MAFLFIIELMKHPEIYGIIVDIIDMIMPKKVKT